MEHHIISITVDGSRKTFLVLNRFASDADCTMMYEVYRKGDMLDTLIPEHNDHAHVVWKSANGILDDCAQMIGEQIEHLDW
jgi:hypothetical protein